MPSVQSGRPPRCLVNLPTTARPEDLAANEHGKLTPGPLFAKIADAPAIPSELHKELPAGEDLVVLRVQEEWQMEEGDFRAGDLLVLAPVEGAANGDLLL